MKSRSICILVLMAGAIAGNVLTQSYMQSPTGQKAYATATTTPPSPPAAAPALDAIPEEAILFRGNTLVILIMGNFWMEQYWDPIDNLISSGYSIKEVVPYDGKFYAIFLEREATP